jgi:hypothetical protein
MMVHICSIEAIKNVWQCRFWSYKYQLTTGALRRFYSYKYHIDACSAMQVFQVEILHYCGWNNAGSIDQYLTLPHLQQCGFWNHTNQLTAGALRRIYSYKSHIDTCVAMQVFEAEILHCCGWNNAGNIDLYPTLPHRVQLPSPMILLNNIPGGSLG